MRASAAKTPTVIVVGGGLAGIAAALSTAKAGASVLLLEEGAALGGKAGSWPEADGRVVEHGLHMAWPFYRRFLNLLADAKISLDEAFVLSGAEFDVFEGERGRLHRLSFRDSTKLFAGEPWLTYSGLPLKDRRSLIEFFAQAALMLESSTGEQLRKLDAVSSVDWAMSLGASPRSVRCNASRLISFATFTDWRRLSAFQCLRLLRWFYVASDQRVYRYRGPGDERIFRGLRRALLEAGVEVLLAACVVELRTEGNRVVEVTCERRTTADGVRRRERIPCDACLLAVGPAAVESLVDERCTTFRPNKLPTTGTINVQVWLKGHSPGELADVLIGLPGPCSVAADVSRFDPLPPWDRSQSLLYFSGTESKAARYSDPELVDVCLAGYAAATGRNIRGQVASTAVVRNIRPSARMLELVPGCEKRRPEAVTSLRNLFLAGDWVKTETGIPSMEGAVEAGERAAALAAEKL